MNSSQSLEVEVDAGRIQAELNALARWSEAEPPAVTRVVFTEQDREARNFVKGLCAEAGLSVRDDAIGNTFARWEGLRSDLAAIATGSHIDAIPGAGMFDGTVGVIGGIEAIRALQRAGFRPIRPIELILFTSEEPTRFGVGCLGSRAMSGALGPEALAALKDGEGRTLDEVRTAAGFGGSLDSVRLPVGHYDAFVELHIEQGPLLEREGLPIGVVHAIAAPATLRITIDGEGGHAGAVLMPDRRDPLPAAAEVILAVEAAARGTGSLDSVATVGICRVTPGAVNGIPSRVVMEVDLRDIDVDRRDRMVDLVRDAAARVAGARNLVARVETLNLDPPMKSAGQVGEVIRATCRDLGLPDRPMVSRAYHDALFMARIAPTAMIFIPCRGGYSHRPEEYSSPEQIATGVRVLAGTLARLAGGSGEQP
jgi:ureidoglycolate amidohydrolase